MPLPLGYFQTLLVIVAVFLVLLVIFLLRERWNTSPTLLRQTLADHHHPIPEEGADALATFLLYEEEYPAFADIMGLALSRFPLDRLQQGDRFRDSFEFLAGATRREESPERIQAEMCRLIHALLEDPDIEYGCRPELEVLIDRFLNQVESRRSKTPIE